MGPGLEAAAHVEGGTASSTAIDLYSDARTGDDGFSQLCAVAGRECALPELRQLGHGNLLGTDFAASFRSDYFPSAPSGTKQEQNLLHREMLETRSLTPLKNCGI